MRICWNKFLKEPHLPAKKKFGVGCFFQKSGTNAALFKASHMCSSLVSRECMVEQEGTQEEKSKKVCSLSLPFLSSFLIWPKEPISPSLPSQQLLRAKFNANFSKSLHSQEPYLQDLNLRPFPPVFSRQRTLGHLLIVGGTCYSI